MTVDFYYLPMSGPCRSVLLTAKAVGVDLNLKEVNLMAGEQLKPEFVAINPQHTVPTLVDGDFILWESRPICTYLATQYGKDNTLYPSDPKTRATVDRLLYFDMGTLYHRFSEYAYPVLFGGVEKVDPKKLEPLHEALAWLNDFLAGHEWAIGNNITVADNVLVATVSTLEASGIDIAKHSNVAAWLEKCKSTLPGYSEVNEPGAVEFGKFAKDKLSTN
ncbi:glutathione S-transferase 1-1 [Procambarus clarkii]|uniref:glutathione S-transferase 1-1 n=1 Tax=Procambarus clarkii TaxID=6728 RepID=UPI001E673409|nr:glutathione S-transferase 1-1-like [Procambarus clarkii]XP_045593880.1 glutathione S-transferase 1-1-like [Procambarus clarkii]